jgi:hypothetical protein
MVAITTMIINSNTRQQFIDHQTATAMVKAGLGEPAKGDVEMTEDEKKIRDKVEVPNIINALFLLPTLAILGCILNLAISIYNKFKGGSSTNDPSIDEAE